MRRLILLAATGLLVAACGGVGVPNFTIPPINIPTLPPFDIPSGLLPTTNPNAAACTLVTAAEVGSIMGSTPSVTDSSEPCTFTFPNFSTIAVSAENGTDLNTSKILFGQSAKDIQVAGLPAATGVFIGQPAVHVQKGANQLQVLGILTGSDDATIQKLVQIATVAVGRMP